MRMATLIALCLLILTTASAQAESPPSFAKARAAARAALPEYTLFSCTRGTGRVVTCEMMRDTRGWRYVRTVAVRKSGKPRVGVARKLCRLPPARRNRCGFSLPRR